MSSYGRELRHRILRHEAEAELLLGFPCKHSRRFAARGWYAPSARGSLVFFGDGTWAGVLSQLHVLINLQGAVLCVYIADGLGRVSFSVLLLSRLPGLKSVVSRWLCFVCASPVQTRYVM